MTASTSRIGIAIDLDAPGRQAGDLQVKWSDNRRPLGNYPVPIVCLRGGPGPTLLLSAGVHGDEFEGPAALMRLSQDLDHTNLLGRVIILPALNAPAVAAASRVSPLDGMNLNRAFPGDPDGTPTQMLAHFVEQVLLPRCDAAIDLHSGGKASRFAACALAQADTAQGESSMALARAFAAPYIWLAGKHNDNRSLNSAAARQAVPMIAVELGGGGGCDPAMTGLAEAGVRRCLAHLGMLPDPVPAVAGEPVVLEMNSPEQNFLAPADGLFDRFFEIGDAVNARQAAGWLHFPGEPLRASIKLEFPCAGTILAHSQRGMVERGETLAMIGSKPSTTEAGG